ncbi:carbon starvation protein A [Elusimicrobiota bacterium]
MNSLVLAGGGLILLFLGYRFYGAFIEKLWDIDPSHQTPAHEINDGIDYVPAKHWTVLFGHHFASIAGAGPIIGPVIACYYWGWLGVLLWLIFGSIFLGAVHDFSSLVVSMKMKGSTIAIVCRDTLGKKAHILFSLFLWLSLILVVGVFAALGAKTLASKPQIVIPAMGIIPLAMIIGFLMYRLNMNQIAATSIGIILLILLIIWGKLHPVDFTDKVADPVRLWIYILLIYAFIASILPVNILLQPRDYLSTFLLFFGLVFGYAGLLITRPPVYAPAFVSFNSKGGPIWPMMFVIVACGAISGFHNIVSSGTTSKQISSEKDAKRIGYGAMIVESALGILALICVAAGLHWSPATGTPVYSQLMKEGWIVVFSEGFGQITRPILGVFGSLIAATILNAFIITTLDTATRVTRYITEETFHIRNKYLSTSVVILIALYFAMGNWKAIWPVFGASNQLSAAMALLVVSAWLMSKNKKSVYTFIPAIIMILTSGTALLWQLNKYITQNNRLLAVISALLILLALYMFFITVQYFIFRNRRNEQTNTI